MNERRNVPEIVIVIHELLRRSQTRINLLFTMSEIPHAHPAKDTTCEVMFRGRYLNGKGRPVFNARPVFALSSYAGHASIAMPGSATHSQRRSVVEPDGIEPTTSCLQSTRSPS